jgi:hypothetical protein
MNLPSSPYIKLFLNKGVRWYFTLTEELTEKAQKEEKLLFIHIGYMGSILNRDYMNDLFSDEETCEILNSNFISIIVDREEKPETFLLGLDLLKLEHDFSSFWAFSVNSSVKVKYHLTPLLRKSFI